MIYTHAMNRDGRGVISPIDLPDVVGELPVPGPRVEQTHALYVLRAMA